MIDANYAKHLALESCSNKLPSMVKDYVSHLLMGAAKIGGRECCICLAGIPWCFNDHDLNLLKSWIELHGYTVECVSNTGSMAQRIGYITVRW